MFEAARAILKQLFLSPATNKFPAKYAPASTIQFLDKVTKGEVKMIPPIPLPPDFRGKVAYYRDKCNGCGLCVQICPTKAIEFLSEDVPRRERKAKVFISRCCFCSQCVEICPVSALAMTDGFLLSAYDKYADELVVTDTPLPPS
jgi:formate hydrogenlyase subunit 6/NADH:ubiquinone oxidoreductase subunit I